MVDAMPRIFVRAFACASAAACDAWACWFAVSVEDGA
jgi:hypothetical protein